MDWDADSIIDEKLDRDLLFRVDLYLLWLYKWIYVYHDPKMKLQAIIISIGFR